MTSEIFISCSIHALVPKMTAKTQPSRPRTLKKSEAKVKNRVAEDRLPRGQGQNGSRPRIRGHLWKYAQI